VAEDGADNAGGDIERVIIAEAADLLGCHPNTVRSRVKAGMYRAEKFHTENGPTWMIERDSLTTNAPTSASQQAVSGVLAAQQEAIQELARAIVREAGIARDSEQEAWLEGNKMAAEAAKALAIVGSGLLVGMAAVASVLPNASLSSPLLYLAFALVLMSIFTGILWMRDIAQVTMSSEGDALGGFAYVAVASFVYGLCVFLSYVLWNSPGPNGGGPDTQREQLRWVVSTLLAPRWPFGQYTTSGSGVSAGGLETRLALSTVVRGMGIL
jgi:hypothetical protein